MEGPQSVVICSTPRSGSTYISQTLASGKRLGKPEEWFQDTTIEERKRTYGMAPSVELQDYLRALTERERGPNGIFSMKIMWDTLVPLLNRLRSIDQADSEKSDIALFESYFPNPRYILITRENKLRQAISYVKAQQSGIWEFRGKKHSYDEKLPQFDYLRIEEARKMLVEHQDEWLLFFNRAGRGFLEIRYESFLDHQEEIVRDVEGFLGLDLDVNPKESKLSLLVMHDSVNADWEERYHEISKVAEVREQAHDGNGLPKDAMRALIEVEPGALKTQAKSPYLLKVSVRNEGTETWCASGFRDGRLWIRLTGSWAGDGYSEQPGEGGRAYLDYDLEPGMTSSLELRMIAPEECGEYRLHLSVEQEGTSSFECVGDTDPIVSVIVERSEACQAAADYFGEAEPQLAGWRWLEWFGYYYEVYFPWIFHQVFGWLYCSGRGSREDSYWLWTKDMGWLWTSRKAYPFFLRALDSKWLRFLDHLQPDVQFQDTETKSILKFKPSMA